MAAARGGWLSLPEGTVCLEDSVTSPDYRGRGVAPAAWSQIAAAAAEDGYATMVTKVRRPTRPLVVLSRERLGDPLRVVDRCDETSAREEFVRLEASGWKGRAGTAIGSTDAHRRCFDETSAAFAEAGRLQLLALEGGGRTVAMQWNLLAADAIFCLKVAHDEELASCSPGAQLEVGAIEAFHRRTDINWIDSCTTPDNELINRLWPDWRRIASVVVARKSLVGRSALAGLRSAVALRDRRRRGASSRGVASRLPGRVD